MVPSEEADAWDVDEDEEMEEEDDEAAEGSLHETELSPSATPSAVGKAGKGKGRADEAVVNDQEAAQGSMDFTEFSDEEGDLKMETEGAQDAGGETDLDAEDDEEELDFTDCFPDDVLDGDEE